MGGCYGDGRPSRWPTLHAPVVVVGQRGSLGLADGRRPCHGRGRPETSGWPRVAGARDDARTYMPMLEKLRAMLEPVDNLRERTHRQVQRQEQRLRERAEQISRSVKEARADGIGLPWMSRETGTDVSYEYERWRRWAAPGCATRCARGSIRRPLPNRPGRPRGRLLAAGAGWRQRSPPRAPRRARSETSGQRCRG